MPGKYDSTNPAASSLTSWAKYRALVAASDDLAHPEVLLLTIDLTKSFHGNDSQIWVTPKLVSGSGTVTLTLVLESNGSLVTPKPYITAATSAGVADLVQIKFTGLISGVYRVLLTLSATSSWDVHVAHNGPPQ